MSTQLADVRHVVEVKCPASHAFAVFTDGIGRWWPLDTHSIAAVSGGPPATGVHLDGRVGGAIVETREDGTTCPWGEVTIWEPPDHLAICWTVSETGAPTTIDITFTPVDGGTRVTLVHSGWDTVERRRSYDADWPGVLGRFSSTAVAAPIEGGTPATIR